MRLTEAKCPEPILLEDYNDAHSCFRSRAQAELSKAPVKLQPDIFAGYAVIRRFFVTPRVVFLGQTIR